MIEGLTVNFGEMELNGNCSMNLSDSLDDLSEYTDADESMSAPTEILAEFMSAVMLKEYEAALKYCKIIRAKQYHSEGVLFIDQTQNLSRCLLSRSSASESQNGVSQNDDSENSSSSREYGSDDRENDGEDMSDLSDYSSGSGLDSSGDLENSIGCEPMLADSDATSASYSSLEDEEAHISSSQRKFRTYRQAHCFLANGTHTTSRDSETPSDSDSRSVFYPSPNCPVSL